MQIVAHKVSTDQTLNYISYMFASAIQTLNSWHLLTEWRAPRLQVRVDRPNVAIQSKATTDPQEVKVGDERYL